jgi:hypothetical protein
MKVPRRDIGEKTASSTNGAGKTGYLHEEDETRFPSLTLYKNQSRMG